MPRYVVTANSNSNGVGSVAAKASIIEFDQSWNESTPNQLPGPGELLASAFAACLLKNVERFSQVLPFDYRGAEVTVELRRQDSPPRFDAIEYSLQINTSEPDRRIDLLARNLKKHGTVFNTLANSCSVVGSVTRT